MDYGSLICTDYIVYSERASALRAQSSQEQQLTASADKQLMKIYAGKGLVFPHHLERARIEGKRIGQEEDLTVNELISTPLRLNLNGGRFTCTLCVRVSSCMCDSIYCQQEKIEDLICALARLSISLTVFKIQEIDIDISCDVGVLLTPFNSI